MTNKIKRMIDKLGRVYIPSNIRELLGVEKGDTIEFVIEKNKIILQKCSDKNIH